MRGLPDVSTGLSSSNFRQGHLDYVVQRLRILGQMLSGLIYHEDGNRDFRQVKVHGVGVAARQNEIRVDPSGRTGGPKI